MPRRASYERELQGVLDNLVLMCRCIESALEKCIGALVDRDSGLINEVYEEDDRIDRLEREIEQSCFKLLVMEHPVASDFREISATLKMITDLERIGDQARDIAEITTQLNDGEYVKKLEHLPQMANIVIQMVRDGVQSYINRDLALARSIDATDDKVDALFYVITEDLTALVKKSPDSARQIILLMMITKYLERIGDHAVNVGEWVVYAITGEHPKKGFQ
jgi:phosphate transport system protein